MKGLKKCLVGLLAVLLLSCVGIACVSCGTTEGTEGLEYYLLADDTYAVEVGTAKYLSDIVIPEKYNGKAVTTILYGAFQDSEVKSVTIPNSVTSIGAYAFYNCSNLTSVTIGNGVTNIGYEAFYNCSSLTNIEIPNSVTSIGYYAFSYCSSLTGVYISDIAAWCNISFSDGTSNPLYYAHNLYLDGTLVTELVIPNSVTSIGAYAFYDCDSLTSVVIPNSVTSIGAYAFENCSSLTGVYISDIATWCNISFSRYDSNPLYYAHNLYLNDSLVTELTIPDDETSIGAYAFNGCSSLTSLTIPDGVTSIGSGAFENCSGLYKVINLSDLELTIGSTSNGYVAYYAKILIDNAGNKTYKQGGYKYIETADGFLFQKNGGYTLIAYLGGKETVILPKDIDGNSYTIYQMRGVVNVIIPKGITRIGDYAFSDCRSLTSVTIPNSVTSIGDYAFSDCSSLTSVTIGNGVTSIGKMAFWNCSSLTSVTIGNSVASIGVCVFAYCRSLTSVVFENTSGWSADSTSISSDSLADPTTAAKYLTDTYYNYYWKRK